VTERDKTQDPEQLFAAGRYLLELKRNSEALTAFRSALEQRPGDPLYSSFYGLCLVKTGRDPAEGRRLCERAVQEAFYRPELFANLGAVFLAQGDRRRAERALRKGLALDRDNRALISLLEEIGIRKRPLFPFLKRRNLLNRLTGKVRHALRASRA